MEPPATLTNATSTPTPESNENKSSGGAGTFILVLISILMLLASGFYAYYYFNSSTPQISEVTSGTTAPCNQGVNNGCGAAPNPLPNFNKTETLNVTQNGELIVYYNGTPGPTANFTLNGAAQNVPLTSGRIATDITVNSGDTLILTGITEQNQGNPTCAEEDPHPNPKYKGTGWIAPNPDDTCGSGLAGPPTGGVCRAFAKVDISAFTSQADPGDTILSQQCWADWREWPGDYDFNDYFIMLAIEPEYIPPTVSCNSLTKDIATPELNDTLTYTCEGSTTNSSNEISYEFRYRLDGGAYSSLSATENITTLPVNSEGDWEVECRTCVEENGTTICSSDWQGTN